MYLRVSWFAASLLCGAVTVSSPGTAPAGDLKEHTLDAFQSYAALTERRVLGQAKATGPFLYLDHLPAMQRDRALADLRRGELFMERLETTGDDGRSIEIKDGLVHHWLGAVFVPGVGVDETLELIQDYDRHAEIYAPAVDDARIIERRGDDFRIFMRFRKKKIITVVVDTIHEVTYVHVAADRVYSISRTISVREVKDAGGASEIALPDGEGTGFLWRINSYWRFLERDGGTYIESESISLTRTIPFMVRWLVAPFVNDMPREQLTHLLQTTRQALTNG